MIQISMLRPKHSKEELLLREILKSKRKSLGVTQKELAEKLGVPQSFVSKYESGERVLAFTEVLMICEALTLGILELEKMIKELSQD